MKDKTVLKGVRDVQQIMDENELEKTIVLMVEQVIEVYRERIADLFFIGIKTRGIPIAQKAAFLIREYTKIDVPVASLEITLYHDDLSFVDPDTEMPVVNPLNTRLNVDGKIIIVWDDVSYTLKTYRAAYYELLKMGRPVQVLFTALVDRFEWHQFEGFAPKIVGQQLHTEANEIVKVRFKEVGDGETSVWIQAKISQDEEVRV